MDYLTKLAELETQLTATTVTVPGNSNLLALLGWHCFSGSMKGISAFGSVRELVTKGADLRGKTLIDASSGNFARGLAAIAEYLGVKCEVIVSTKATEDTLSLIRVHGAKVTVGGDTTRECYQTAQDKVMAAPDRYILTGQLDNPGNSWAHKTFTAPLIPDDVDEVYLAMGSGGGMHGICSKLINRTNPPRVYVTIATHGEKIVGTFSNELDYETPFIKEARSKQWIEEELSVSSAEARNGMVELRKNGLMAGFSSGGVYYAYQKRLNSGKSKGRAMILCWDGGDRWINKL